MQCRRHCRRHTVSESANARQRRHLRFEAGLVAACAAGDPLRARVLQPLYAAAAAIDADTAGIQILTVLVAEAAVAVAVAVAEAAVANSILARRATPRRSALVGRCHCAHRSPYHDHRPLRLRPPHSREARPLSLIHGVVAAADDVVAALPGAAETVRRAA